MYCKRLLILGTLIVSLAMGSAASAQQCNATLADGLSPSGGTFQFGDTIEYEITLFVPESDGITFCELTNVSVYFFPPPGLPPGSPCVSTGQGVLVASGLTLTPGADIVIITSAQNAALSHTITEANCDSENLIVVANMAVTFFIEDGDDLQCDEKRVENEVEPVDTPTCGIVGPETVCEGEDDVVYESEFEADTYLWSIEDGDASIDGDADGPTVMVDVGESGTYTLKLEVCNENGADGCCDDCEVEVDVLEAPECLIEGPDSVCDDDTEIEYCASVLDADRYEWTIDGDGEIVGDNTGSCVLVSPTGNGDFTLMLEICTDNPENGECCSECEKPVEIVAPDCSIDGPETVCAGTTEILHCGPEGMDSYSWDITGNGTIVGPEDERCVTVNAGDAGEYTLTLEVCQESDNGECCDECELRVTVDDCGVFCSFTQGFWGNAGGKSCDGKTTTEIILGLIDAPNASTPGSLPLVVGVLGERSITFDTADCILERLPTGGKPRPLPSNLEDKNCGSLPPTILKKGNKKGARINNVLVGQVVALTLNLRLDSIDCHEDIGDLAAWEMPDVFCTQHDDDCPMQFHIPESLEGFTVGELLAMANRALAGIPDEGDASIGDIYEAASSINEGFDECAEVVECTTEEICGNGCDDDFDEEVDEDDCIDD